MLYRPELIIYLWMVPVLAMVILPALFYVTGMVYRGVERSRLSDIRGFVALSSGTESSSPERRKNHRILLNQGQKAKIAKLDRCCQSQVVNMSESGLCLQNVPRKIFEDREGSLRVVLRTRTKDYPMLVQPKWRNSSENGFTIGTEIKRSPAGWQDLIEALCKKSVPEPA
jgi:hypothetical protein